MSLIAVTAYYNPGRYRSRYRNYQRFRRNLTGLPLLTVELVFDGRSRYYFLDICLMVVGLHDDAHQRSPGGQDTRRRGYSIRYSSIGQLRNPSLEPRAVAFEGFSDRRFDGSR
jgi:hypothetical protein